MIINLFKTNNTININSIKKVKLQNKEKHDKTIRIYTFSNNQFITVLTNNE